MKFSVTVTDKYQMSFSLAVNKITQKCYFINDTKNLHSVNNYVQAMLRYKRSADNSNRSSLIHT